MVPGNIKKTWTAKDFKQLKYRLGNAGKPFAKIGASKDAMKNYKNTAGAYLCNDLPAKFIKIAHSFGLEKTVVAMQKMKVGQVLPWHTDTCSTYIKNNNVKNKNKIVRIIVFVEDTRPGHQLWIKDMLCAGKAGSYYGWEFGTKHMAANLGEQDRYTLQITGIK
tara:strand:+ start:2117 stop:2608 length:492 start_codon:yes stop_codon:yes gene_type:complete